MGKHSNIIFVDNDTILDSIKHVNSIMSSVRQVLPGKEGFYTGHHGKKNPLTVERKIFLILFSRNQCQKQFTLPLQVSVLSIAEISAMKPDLILIPPPTH